MPVSGSDPESQSPAHSSLPRGLGVDSSRLASCPTESVSVRRGQQFEWQPAISSSVFHHKLGREDDNLHKRVQGQPSYAACCPIMATEFSVLNLQARHHFWCQLRFPTLSRPLEAKKTRISNQPPSSEASLSDYVTSLSSLQ